LLEEWLNQRPELRAAWSKELGADCSDKSVLAGLLQAGSLARNQRGIVLFSSKNAQRIKHAARVASGEVFSADQVEWFLELTKAVLTEAQRR
jgi:hypothetical protein